MQDRVRMHFIAWKNLVPLFFVALSGTALAQEPTQEPSVQDGMYFAYRWCYTCHRASHSAAPRFESLIGERDITAQYLQRYAANPSHKMLKFELTDRDAANLHAYIETLAPPTR